MAELPEIYNICKQMNEVLKEKVISAVEVKQEKCLNLPVEDMLSRLLHNKIQSVANKGKWIVVKLSNNENMLISLGMGGDLLYFEPDKAMTEYQIKVLFADQSGFTIKFWWFGKFHIWADEELLAEKSVKDIAIDPFDEKFSYEHFRGLFHGKKGKVKPVLLDQKKIGGIGNMYIHDILFKSKIHPDKKISEITEADFEALYQNIVSNLKEAYSKGGFSYEKDFKNQNGGYSTDEFLVGYREGKECPVCGGIIEQIKTGGNSSYICPKCQRI